MQSHASSHISEVTTASSERLNGFSIPRSISPNTLGHHRFEILRSSARSEYGITRSTQMTKALTPSILIIFPLVDT